MYANWNRVIETTTPQGKVVKRVLSEEVKEQLLQIIFRFEIVLPNAEKPDELIVPSLLPEAVPSVFPQYWPSSVPAGYFEMGRCFGLDVVLKGFFPKVIYRAYHLPEGKACGVLTRRHGAGSDVAQWHAAASEGGDGLSHCHRSTGGEDCWLGLCLGSERGS